MPESPTKITLSPTALSELKEILHVEYGYDLPDTEAQEMGLRLLGLFEVLLGTPIVETVAAKPTEKQLQAMEHIRDSIMHQERQPTVRSIAAALNLKSSRSGLRMLNSLFARGLISKNGVGEIVVNRSALSYYGNMKPVV